MTKSKRYCGDTGITPFRRYRIYGPYISKSLGRKVIVMIRRVRGLEKRYTTTYARFKMAVHLGRRLRKTEEVDHIDNNRRNDRLSNLQVITSAQNRAKAARNSAGRLYVLLRCPSCGTTFEREKRNTYLSKSGVFTACSASCRGRFSALIQSRGYKSKDVKHGLRKNLVREFRRKCDMVK